MKNFTLVAAGLMLAMTATAGVPKSTSIPLQQKANRMELPRFTGEAKAMEDIHSLLSMRSNAKKAASVAEIEGDYTFALGDYYTQSSQGDIDVEGSIYVDNGFTLLEWNYYPYLPAVGEYDESKGELNFSPINLGQYQFEDGDYYIICFPSVWDWDEEDVFFEDYSAPYNEATKSFEFPVDHGFIWAISEDDKGQNLVGYYFIIDVIGAVKYEPVIDPNWVDYDTAYYVDGWMIPAFGVDPEEYGWDVKVQQNVNNPNLFRLDNPYKEPECAISSQASRGGYIEFDITDPNHVPVTAGIFNGMMNGQNQVMNTNFLGYVYQYYGGQFTYAEIIEDLENDPEYDGVFSTYEDGYVYFEECRIQIDGEGCYSWQLQDGSSAEAMMNGYLVFNNKVPDPSDSKVAANVAEEGAVEFFNLQGVRVANPQTGQLVIKRQGDKASKIIVK